jgi:glycine cleavage system H protein
MHHLPHHLKDMYFTTDHEWIWFEGSLATIGLASFKLTGYKKIAAYFLVDPEGPIKAGTTVASFEYGDYVVDLQMPVTGRILEWNKSLFGESPVHMLESINQFTWIARILPASPSDKAGLLQATQYKPLLKTYGAINY